MKMDKFPNYLSDSAEEFYYINVDCGADSDDDESGPDTIVKPKTYDELKTRFLSHFLRGDYKTHLMKELDKRKHKPDESILNYITSIKAICHDLDRNMSSEQKMSYILEGLDDETAAQITYFNPTSVSSLENIARNVEQGRELLRKSKPDLSKNKKVNAIQSLKPIKSETKGSDILDAINKLNESIGCLAINKNFNTGNRSKSLNTYQSYKNQGQNSKFNRNPNNNGTNYNNRNPSYSQNKFYNQYRNYRQNSNEYNGQNSNNNFQNNSKIMCFRCQKFGHKKSECRTNLNDKNNKNESNTEMSGVGAGAGAATEVKTVNNVMLSLSANTNQSMILIDVEIKGKTYKALVDSGSEITIMKKEIADELKLNINQYRGPSVHAVNGNILEYFGEVSVDLCIKNDNNVKFSILMPVLVVDKLPADLLLGVDSLAKLNVKIDCFKREITINDRKVNSINTTIDSNVLKEIKECNIIKLKTNVFGNKCMSNMAQAVQAVSSNEVKPDLEHEVENKNENFKSNAEGYVRFSNERMSRNENIFLENSKQRVEEHLESKHEFCADFDEQSNKICDNLDVKRALNKGMDVCWNEGQAVVSAAHFKSENECQVPENDSIGIDLANVEEKAINFTSKGFIHVCSAYTVQPMATRIVKVKTSHKNKFKGKLCLLLTEDLQYNENKVMIRNILKDIKIKLSLFKS
jgi:hypothetical protein